MRMLIGVLVVGLAAPVMAQDKPKTETTPLPRFAEPAITIPGPDVRTIAGQVTNHDGDPVAGLQVAFLKPNHRFRAAVYCRTTTDPDGRYSTDVDVSPGHAMLGGTGNDYVKLWLSGVDANSGCPISFQQVWTGTEMPTRYDVRLPELAFARIVAKTDEPNTVLAGLDLCVSGDWMDDDPAGLRPQRRWSFGTTARTDVHGLVIAVVPVGKFRLGYKGENYMDGCSVHESPRKAPSRVVLQGAAEPMIHPPKTFSLMKFTEGDDGKTKSHYAFEYECRAGDVCDVELEVSRDDLERLANMGW